MNRLQDEQYRHKPDMNIALLAICLGYFMVILDTTIVNVALLNMQHELGATVIGLQWIVDGYTLVFASLLLTAGALGDRLGSKRIFLVGLLLFTSASALCGMAPTLIVLEIMRVVQGVGAALLVPGSLSLLSQIFSTQKERARAIGVWGGIGGIAALAGPVLGGFLVNAWGWRSVFFVNVPVGLSGFVLTLWFVRDTPVSMSRGLDVLAQCIAIVALGSLTFACIEGSPFGWFSPLILTVFMLFIVMALAFVFFERHTIAPMLPLRVFSVPAFSAGTLVGLLLNFGFYGQLFLLSLFFQQIKGYSPLLTGLALLPETGMAMFASTLAGRVTGRVGPRWPMMIGLSIGATGLFLMLFVGIRTPYVLLCSLLVAIGFGTAFTMPAMTTAVVEATPKTYTGIAAAVLNASRQMGSVLGVAILGALIDKQQFFVEEMHLALCIAGGAFLLGLILSLVWVKTA